MSEKDPKAQAVLTSFKITPKDDEVLLQADIPQKTVADFLSEQAQKKATKPATKAPHRRVSRRRVRRSG